LGEGWALTPETAGLAREDRRGPAVAPIEGWVRRRAVAATVVFGGRNLGGDPGVHATMAIDGRPIHTETIAPGFFLRLLHLQPGALAGAGDYAAVSVSADSPHVAIEQFDVQSDDRVVFGYAEGWQEEEHNPATGAVWRWTSERATLRVHAAGQPLRLALTGEPPRVAFSKPSHVRISAGGRIVAERTLSDRFAIDVTIPAELVAGPESTITIETDQVFRPADRWRGGADRRHLGLRVFYCALTPAS
jgi:hypothetical protein